MNRNIDEQLLMDLAGQIGLETQRTSTGSKNSQNDRFSGHETDPQRQARAVAEAMKGKSDSEILEEIMKVKAVLQKNPGAYEKQIRAVKSLRGMMNPEQRQRLDQVLKLLER